MENRMENTVELNLDQMEEAAGGKANYGGYEKKPADKAGYVIYRIQSGDVLGRIARKFGTTVQKILAANPCIPDQNRIMAGYYIYIPA